MGSSLGSAIAPGTSSAVVADKRDGLKKILDALVVKGVITQAQEDAILLAIEDAAPTRVKARPVLRDLLGAASQYLDIPEKELHTKLSGTSLSAVANASSAAGGLPRLKRSKRCSCSSLRATAAGSLSIEARS